MNIKVAAFTVSEKPINTAFPLNMLKLAIFENHDVTHNSGTNWKCQTLPVSICTNRIQNKGHTFLWVEVLFNVFIFFIRAVARWYRVSGLGSKVAGLRLAVGTALCP